VCTCARICGVWEWPSLGPQAVVCVGQFFGCAFPGRPELGARVWVVHCRWQWEIWCCSQAKTSTEHTILFTTTSSMFLSVWLSAWLPQRWGSCQKNRWVQTAFLAHANGCSYFWGPNSLFIYFDPLAWLTTDCCNEPSATVIIMVTNHAWSVWCCLCRHLFFCTWRYCLNHSHLQVLRLNKSTRKLAARLRQGNIQLSTSKRAGAPLQTTP